MSGELEKMQEFRCQYSDTSFTELMLLYEVVIELICKHKTTQDEWTDYALYDTLKRRLNTTMYQNLYPQGKQPSREEFLNLIGSIHDTHVWRNNNGTL